MWRMTAEPMKPQPPVTSKRIPDLDPNCEGANKQDEPEEAMQDAPQRSIRKSLKTVADSGARSR
jgi:hypothetical protein